MERGINCDVCAQLFLYIVNAKKTYDQIKALLESQSSENSAELISKYILEDVFGIRSAHISTDAREIDTSKVHEILQRLSNNEPYQYIGNRADFFGRSFYVDQRVLIPRPETEELTHRAIQVIKQFQIRSVIDIGTGSGVIPITIALETDIKSIFGLDICKDALAVAEINAKKYEVQVQWIQGDIKDRETVDHLPHCQLVISNPPYISQEEKAKMDANVLDFEPHKALFVKEDPLEFYKSICEWIKREKDEVIVLFEISEYFADDVSNLMKRLGFSDVVIYRDLQGKKRIAEGRFKSDNYTTI